MNEILALKISHISLNLLTLQECRQKLRLEQFAYPIQGLIQPKIWHWQANRIEGELKPIKLEVLKKVMNKLRM